MKNGNFKSLNKDQAKRCIAFFLREAFNYKNFDEHGRYIPKSIKKNNKKIFGNKNRDNIVQNKENPSIPISTNDMVQALNIGNNFFESQFRLEKVESNKQNSNTSNSNENQKSDTNQQSSTNESLTPIIKLSDEQTLNMILKIVFTILDFVKDAMDDSSDE